MSSLWIKERVEANCHQKNLMRLLRDACVTI